MGSTHIGRIYFEGYLINELLLIFILTSNNVIDNFINLGLVFDFSVINRLIFMPILS
jgi:hypothetical protein